VSQVNCCAHPQNQRIWRGYSTWLRNMELGVPEEDEEEPQPGTSAGGGRNLGLPTHFLELSGRTALEECCEHSNKS